MTQYLLTNRVSARVLGFYQGNTPEEAITAMTNEAGYEDAAEAAEALSISEEQYTADFIAEDVKDVVRSALADTEVWYAGSLVEDPSECYVALAQCLDGTLPTGYTVRWGKRNHYSKQVIKDAPHEVWEAAVRGELSL